VSRPPARFGSTLPIPGIAVFSRGNFRYVGDGGSSYIFNLSTKGLGAGTYALRFYVGANHSLFYTVQFEVK
jgi:hypothetical protein